jgi:hypothetical protein
MKYRIPFNMGDQVTLKETSSSGTFLWSLPNVEADNTCITLAGSEVSTTERTFTVQAKIAECRFSIMRSAADPASTMTA